MSETEPLGSVFKQLQLAAIERIHYLPITADIPFTKVAIVIYWAQRWMQTRAKWRETSLQDPEDLVYYFVREKAHFDTEDKLCKAIAKLKE